MFLKNPIGGGGGGGSVTPGGGSSGFTPGSVIFADALGALNQDNASFFWDITNKRLGIGTAAPAAVFDMTGSISPAANASSRLARFAGTLVEAGSGTHALLANVEIATPTITAGAATVTAAASLYVQGAPTGTFASYTAAAAIAPDTDALSIIGHLAIGSWISTDEIDLAHYDARTSTTQYFLRSATLSATAPTLLNAPGANGRLYFQIGGSFAVGWTMGDGVTAVAHLVPLSNNAYDIGSTSLRPRTLYVGTSAIIVGSSVSTEYLSVGADTDGPAVNSPTAIIGRGAMGAQVSDYFTLAHVDRFSASGYALSQRSSDGATFVNSAAAIYFGIAGNLAWLVNSSSGLQPYNHNAVDIGTTGTRPRDLWLGRDIEIDGAFNHDGTTFGALGATPVVQQTSGADLTNNVTSGGTDNTITDWAIVDYATDAAAIRNAVYQLARKLKQINDGVRLFGFFT